MRALPVVGLLGITIAIGLWMGLQYLRGQRNKVEIIGIHFLLGVGGLEVLLMIMVGPPDGDVVQDILAGQIAAGFIAAAMVIAIIAALGKRKSKGLTDITLAVHALLALLGFGLLLYWASGL